MKRLKWGVLLMTGVIKITNRKYPRLLKKIPDPPEKLYYKGSWDADIFKDCLAVVGARRMTRYGEQITDLLVSEIAAAGITIVSGFMYGIDASAHKAALKSGGRTIACMPCGIDVVHPAHQEELYNEIIENNGLIISEYENDFPPALWTYPKRNRIVAGLSKATLVVEAGEKSGSLITADLTRKFERKLFSVPGQLTSAMSKGTVNLIKEGAGIVTSASDILAYYGAEGINKLEKNFLWDGLNNLEQSIIKELERESMEIDVLSRAVKTPVAVLGRELSLMQLKGLVKEGAGKYYLKVTKTQFA
ncbi:MAG: DNA-protecting protein DprA [PVC group bacterium]|nr:DNA-protecting protein DprA [PVC group bacterium]